MNRIVALSTLAASFVIATGCTPIQDAFSPDYELGIEEDGWSDDWYESNAAGQMRGELPEAGAFDAELSMASIWASNGWLEMDLHVTEDRWAMIGGGFDTQELQDGETVVFEEGDHWVFGCGGPDDWNALYDAPAETVAVTRTDIVVDGVDAIELVINVDFGIDGSDGEVEAVVVQPVQNGND